MGLQNLPSVDEVLKDERIREVKESNARSIVVQAVRQELGRLREEIRSGGPGPDREQARARVVRGYPPTDGPAEWKSKKGN